MEVFTAEKRSTVHSSRFSRADFLQAEAVTSDCSQSALCNRQECPRGDPSADASGKSATKLRVLFVEDNPADVELELLTLRKDGFEVSSDVALTAAEFTSRIETVNYDVILADYNLPQWKGTEALDILCSKSMDVPLIVVTGYLGEEKAVDYIKLGAADCVLKDHLERLPNYVCRALEEKAVRQRQKASDDALRESQAQLEALVQSAMDAILTVDEAQRIVMFNVAAEKMFRCSQAEALGQPIDCFIPQRFRAAHSAHVRKFGETGATSRAHGKFEALSASRADGEEFPMEASISHSKVGSRTLFTIIVRDITEREQAERALHESEQRYRLLFSEMAVGFALLEVIYDEQGRPCDHRYLELNPAFETHTGLPRDKVLGKTIREVLPGIEPDWIETYGKVATTGESVHFENYAQTLQKWFEVTAFRTRQGQLAVTFADVSKRKQAEEVLNKSRITSEAALKELARSNAELEQFAYVASHDLQEPLRMIANYTQLLAERYRGKLDEQADKYIAYAVDGTVRMQALIQDLLKFSRAGRQEIEPGTTDCRAAAQQAVKNLQAAVEESGAVVNWNGLPEVRADASQLTQVFQNLIANAIKFHGAEKPVIQIDAEKKDNEWVLAVSDNGIGIPPENWQNIFVIFRRLHTRAEYAGNGIGLAICKKIIERQGGRIWIEAQDKPGCCFKFTLPAEPMSEAAQEAHA